MPDLQQPARTAEEQLAETQQKLAEAEKQLAEAPKALQDQEQQPGKARKRPIEGIYDKIDVPVRYVDYFIIAVLVAFAVVVGLGILSGKGIL